VSEGIMQVADRTITGARQVRQNMRFALIETQARSFDVESDLVCRAVNPWNEE